MTGCMPQPSPEALALDVEQPVENTQATVARWLSTLAAL